MQSLKKNLVHRVGIVNGKAARKSLAVTVSRFGFVPGIYFVPENVHILATNSRSLRIASIAELERSTRLIETSRRIIFETELSLTKEFIGM